ncbi:glucose-6-phosphate dehydrogenase [Temperatibacter marinus]|uniref:Glucose-6-phosphate 1-dehydrogenase n=1 Tax=Temperatibacter marinus TaxID=1456591 RepID=A0AA52EGC1_9PROT|nr:glucose-6-phosphate dehydrogenase [Temperatibacter marinus]WND03163.1 glucose-6-phosphate dehydrogenase [Temperatibacter marinus]
MNKAFDLIIFGGMGDLSKKKLLPALYSGWLAGHFHPDTRIFLTSRRAPDQSMKEWLQDIFSQYKPARSVTEERLNGFCEHVEFITLDLMHGCENWQKLHERLTIDGQDRIVTSFLAIPPSLFTSVCSLLDKHGINTPNCRVVLEKPLGHDLESAKKINAEVAQYFSEEQTFRIDHYLGKEAVQNLLALRFSNIIFEKLWDSSTIDHVQITIAEDMGLKGRDAYYDDSGALRDMVQNHLLQLLCLVAMEPPARMDGDSIREEKLKVLKSLEPMTNELVKKTVVRGQYVAGAVNGEPAGGYADDLNLKSSSSTESFVAIRASIQNWRWANVPFYLRTGKRLADRFAEIVIQFKDIPHHADPEWTGGALQPNRFIIRLQPDDKLVMSMMVKNHSVDDGSLKEVELDLDVTDDKRVGPYMRLILAATRGDHSLFVHREEVEYAWQWIDSIIEAWQSGKGGTLFPYQAGSWGPYEAHDLINREGRQWFHESKVR